jgi:hypothetical protein
MGGEGIEYNLGCAKGFYRCLPITEKRTKNKFRESVKKSISCNITTTERQQMSGCRARQYMLAYSAIDNNNDAANEPTTAANGGEPAKNDNKKNTFALIESVIKTYRHTYKTHRSVADLDTGYINQVVSAMKMASFIRRQQQQTSKHGKQQQQQQQSEQGQSSSGSASG